MARPVKNTVDYFPHYCNHKKTIFILEQQYGNNGYAFWFKLLELLGSTEKHFINCNNKSNWKFLQAKTHFTEEKCIEILNLLVELEAIDKDLWNKKIIWCQNFIDNIADVYKNRRVTIPIKPSFYKQKPQQSDISTNINRQSKVKKSKVKIKNIKKNKNKDIYIDIFDFWNLQKIIEHKKMSDKIKRKINGILKDGYSESEIKQSIENYSKILKNDKYYWTHKWTLIDFLQRGFEKFKDWDIAQENYLNKENQQQREVPVRDLPDKYPWEN